MLSKFMQFMIIGALLILYTSCMADAPVEEWYASPGEIPACILRESQGALSINCQDLEFHKGNSEMMLEEAKLETFRRENGQFVLSEVMALDTSLPLSGLFYGGFHKVWRFPIVAIDGEYVEIVYNVELNMRAWIRPDEIGHHMPKTWQNWVETDLFTGNSSGKVVNPVSVIITGRSVPICLDISCKTTSDGSFQRNHIRIWLYAVNIFTKKTLVARYSFSGACLLFL